MIETVPLWGSFSVIGVLVGIIVTVMIMDLRGDRVSRKQLDQVQKIADTFQKAWEISEQTKEGLVDVLNKLTVGQDTILRILQSYPPSSEDEGGGDK